MAVYDTLNALTRPISDLLKEGTKRIGSGENVNTVTDEIRSLIPKKRGERGFTLAMIWETLYHD